MLTTVCRRLPGVSTMCQMTSPVQIRWAHQGSPKQKPGEIVYHQLEGQEGVHLMTIQNGEKLKPTFTAPEMHNRLAKLRKYMVENDIEGALFTSPQSINYYSDFLYCNSGRPYGLAVTDDTATTISPLVDWAQPWRRANTCGNLVYTNGQRDNFWRAVQKELGHVRGKIGVEFDHMPLGGAPKMQQSVSNALETVDIGDPVANLRLVKSEEEIQLIRACAATADLGCLAQMEIMKEGVTESEISAHGTQAMVRHMSKTFPETDLKGTFAQFQTGSNTDGCHYQPSYNILDKGIMSSINSFTMISGYHAALKRTVFLDYVPDEYFRFWDINCKVVRRGIELIQPGAKCADIIKELNQIYRSEELHNQSQVTITCDYSGREGALQFEDTETVLEPNMVVSIEPMLVIQDGNRGAGGYREHDIVLVTESGHERLSRNGHGPKHFVIKKFLHFL